MKLHHGIIVVALLPLQGFADEEKLERAEYFPAKTFGEEKELHDFIADWYSGQLLAMGELPLPKRAGDKEAVIYRFTCLRTFHRPFCVKLTKIKRGYLLERKVLSGKGGYEPGKIEESAKSKVTDAAVLLLEDLLVELKFLKMKSTVDEVGGRDGSQWILEVVKDGRYKIVDRWTPGDGAPMWKIGEWFLGKAMWKPKELY